MPRVKVRNFRYSTIVVVILGVVVLLCVGGMLYAGFRQDLNGRATGK